MSKIWKMSWPWAVFTGGAMFIVFMYHLVA
jgi:hypothetical protein